MLHNQLKMIRDLKPRSHYVEHVSRLSDENGKMTSVVIHASHACESCNPSLYTIPYLMANGGPSALKEIPLGMLTPNQHQLDMMDFNDVDDITFNETIE